MVEFNATLLQYHGNSSSTYFREDYNIDRSIKSTKNTKCMRITLITFYQQDTMQL